MAGIPYKAAGPAINAVVVGEVQLMIATAPSASPHVKSGRLRALAVTSAQPSALFPDLPTVAASGLPGYESGSLAGVFVPGKTPAKFITRLNQEIVRVLNRTDLREKCFGAGADIVGSSAEQFAALIKSELVRIGKVIKIARIKAE